MQGARSLRLRPHPRLYLLDPGAIFDLSYGENAATLAIAFDVLHDTLSADERAAFVDIARRRALRPFLAHTGRGETAHWYRRADSN